MKRIVGILNFVIVFLIVGLASLQLFAQETTIKFEPGNLEYINPTPGKICIVATTPIPAGLEASRSAYKDVLDCGFNTIVVSGNDQYLKKQFDLVKGLDLKVMLSSGSLRNDNYRNFINTFRSYSQLGGWVFIDEPAYDKLKELKSYYDKVSALDSRHLLYLNLVGAQIKAFTGSTKDYTQYLNLIQRTFHPAVWSYDLYPLSVKYGIVEVNYDLFYSDFDMVSKMAKQTQRPFWAFCQSMGFKNKAVERPEPREEYLRFEAFSALAYGAQGIVYWTYGQRKSTTSETYNSALVNMNGKKSKAWTGAQKVNSEIQKYNDVFFECDVKEVKHVGNKIYKGTTKLSGGIGPFSSVKSGKGGIMISRLENKGKKYIVIVSRDIMNFQDVVVKLSPGNSVVNITDQNQKKYNNSEEIKFPLEKGSYIIFNYE